LEFNVPFQHKYGYIRDECDDSKTPMCLTCDSLIASLMSRLLRTHNQFMAFVS